MCSMHNNLLYSVADSSSSYVSSISGMHNFELIFVGSLLIIGCHPCTWEMGRRKGKGKGKWLGLKRTGYLYASVAVEIPWLALGGPLISPFKSKGL